jgi:hypothetical protein
MLWQTVRVTSPALDDARRRIAARSARDRIARHLESLYGVSVSGLSELELGVYRVDRVEGPAWERAATAGPLSVLDGQAVLVTEFVPGVPPAERAAVIRDHGGLRRLGELLGELHALPQADGAAARPGGAWHHLADGGPADEIRAIQALLAECADAAAPKDRPHFATLARELADADVGDGLPTALIHPDFVLVNVIASPEQGMVLVARVAANAREVAETVGPRVAAAFRAGLS